MATNVRAHDSPVVCACLKHVEIGRRMIAGQPAAMFTDSEYLAVAAFPKRILGTKTIEYCYPVAGLTT